LAGLPSAESPCTYQADAETFAGSTALPASGCARAAAADWTPKMQAMKIFCAFVNFV
jgi:hypothetical protein